MRKDILKLPNHHSESVIDVSIIIPAHNTGRYLGRCLDSVISQKGVAIEIIVVDDGSDDCTFELCKSYNNQFENILLLQTPGLGVSGARNFGLDNASGRYIWFVDADDYVASNCLSCFVELADKNNLDILEFGYSVTSSDSYVFNYDFADAEAVVTDSGLLELYFRDHVIETPVWNKLFRDKLFQQNRFELGMTAEDELLMPRLVESSSTYGYCNSIAYAYRQRSGSITHSKKTHKLDVLIVHRRNLEYFSQKYGNKYTSWISYRLLRASVFLEHDLRAFLSPQQTEMLEQEKINSFNRMRLRDLRMCDFAKAIVFRYFSDFYFMLKSFISPEVRE